MVDLRSDWLELLEDEFSAPYMANLRQFLLDERAAGHRLFPPMTQLFTALELTGPDAVAAVILGQDPYHGVGQAHGLSFSVPRGTPIPPSLRNIHEALFNDLGCPAPSHGNLEQWAAQGVLLLNTVLTVREGHAGSHRKRGWERFTDAILRVLNAGSKPIVFMLWGKPAQTKAGLIDTAKHHVLTAPHPSPLSAYRGFLNCQHFSQANRFLIEQGRASIDWHLRD